MRSCFAMCLLVVGLCLPRAASAQAMLPPVEDTPAPPPAPAQQFTEDLVEDSRPTAVSREREDLFTTVKKLFGRSAIDLVCGGACAVGGAGLYLVGQEIVLTAVMAFITLATGNPLWLCCGVPCGSIILLPLAAAVAPIWDYLGYIVGTTVGGVINLVMALVAGQGSARLHVMRAFSATALALVVGIVPAILLGGALLLAAATYAFAGLVPIQDPTLRQQVGTLGVISAFVFVVSGIAAWLVGVLVVRPVLYLLGRGAAVLILDKAGLRGQRTRTLEEDDEVELD